VLDSSLIVFGLLGQGLEKPSSSRQTNGMSGVVFRISKGYGATGQAPDGHKN
jgi:hypothetical protein